MTGISIDLNSIKPQEVMQANALKKPRTSPKTRFAGKSFTIIILVFVVLIVLLILFLGTDKRQGRHR